MIGGSVHAAESREGLARVRVQLLGLEGKLRRRFVRTGDDGLFQIPFTKEEQDLVRAALPQLTLRVSDLRDRTLAKVELAECDLDDTRVYVPEALLVDPTLAGGRAILRDHVMPTIDDAIMGLDASRQARARAAFDQLRCGLPPVLEIPDILPFARGSVAGIAGDAAAFRDVLDQLEAWNLRKFPERPAVTGDEAKKLLAAWTQKPGAHSHAHDGVLEREALVTLAAAAMMTAAGDPVRTVRNVLAIGDQVHAVRQIQPLFAAARESLRGRSDRFVQLIGFFGGLCPYDDLPHGGAPFPLPWPRPVPFDDDCPELIAVLAEAIRNRTTFSIASIDPVNACPGETLTIRGRGLVVGDTMPSVGFPVSGGGATLFVAVEPGATDTEVEVVVPASATCGPLEMEVPYLPPQIVCGIELDFPATMDSPPTQFLGGATTIREFRRSGSGCLHSGEPVTFVFDACNARSLELRITVQQEGAPSRTHVYHLSARAESHTFRLTTVTGRATLRATLVAEGCGRDERSISIGIARPFSDDPVALIPVEFTNWHGNVSRRALSVAPATLDELVASVRFVERLHLRLGVKGTAWSYTDCVLSRQTVVFVDTDLLARRLRDVLPRALRSEVRSVFSEEVHERWNDEMGRALPPARERLAHVEGGIKLHALNCELLTDELAIPNLGGASGQSIAGTINTSTHGANCAMQPITDLARAIHLVANGGQQWWIEPADNPVTDEAVMRQLMAEGVLDPCLQLRYDNQLFDAVLCAMGAAGVVYSLVLETVPAHTLHERTQLITWEEARRRLQDDVITPARAGEWFLEISMNPSPGRPVWYTTRTPTPEAPDPDPAPGATHDPLDVHELLVWLFGTGVGGAAIGLGGAIIGFGTGVIAGVMAGLSTYFVQRQAEWGVVITNPFLWWRIPELARDLDVIPQLIDAVTGLIHTLNAHLHGPPEAVERALATAMPPLLNAMHEIGFFHISGQQLLDTIQNMFTTLTQRPPGEVRGQSFRIFTEQPPCGTAPTPAGPLIQLVESQEYIVDADQLVAINERVLEAADRVRNVDKSALILILNLRVTARTRASLGMQQFAKSGHIEIWTIKGMEGNPAFFEAVQRIVEDFDAIPHWGHLHTATDLHGKYPRHREWRDALNTIARGAGRPNTFRQRFTRARGLLEDL